MHQQHLAGEIFGFCHHGLHEVTVATDGWCQAFIELFCFWQIKAGVSLKDHHQTPCFTGLGALKRLFQPRYVGHITLCMLFVGSGALLRSAGAFVRAVLGVKNQVVVAAWNVQPDEFNGFVMKAHVFDKRLAQSALTSQRHGALTQAGRLRKHNFAHMRQTLQTIVAAVVQAVAVGPLVVAGDVDHRFFHAVEHGQSVGVHVVSALGAAVFDVTVVDRKRDVRTVDAFEHRRKFGVIARFSVRHVTPQTE